jgi:polynucleotide 5'-hydroxyl-kinase GRC3/NOL9
VTFISYNISNEWKELALQVIQPNQTIMVIGKVDMGKSTLCRFLADEGIKRRLKVAVVDADVGQSWIGPPTTVGMKLVVNSIDELNDPPDALYFVGWISPERHLLQTVVGVKMMVDAAFAQNADVVIVDTTGLIEGAVGSVLKHSKVELLRPNHIIFIQQNRELDLLIRSLQNISTHKIHLLSRSKNVERKSKEYRRQFREDKFNEYFANCDIVEIPISQIRGQRTTFFNGKKATAKELENLSNLVDDHVLYAEWSYRGLSIVTIDRISGLTVRRICSHLSLDNLNAEIIDDFEQILVALLDEKNRVLSLGVIQGIDFNAGALKIISKPEIVKATRVIQFGSYRMDGKDVD